MLNMTKFANKLLAGPYSGNITADKMDAERERLDKCPDCHKPAFQCECSGGDEGDDGS